MRPFVLQVITSPTGGGAEAVVRQLNQALPDHGIDSRAVYFVRPETTRLLDREHSLELRSPRDPRAVLRLRSFLQSTVPASDRRRLLIHAHLTWPLYYCPAATPRGIGGLIYTEHSTSNARRRIPSLALIERSLYARYARLVAVSSAVADSLEHWLGRHGVRARIAVIPNGARRLTAPPDRAARIDRGLRLISVASLEPHKGLDIAIKAVAGSRDCVEEYRIVGRGGVADELLRLCDALKIADKIAFRGWRDDIESELAWADAFLMPSRREGFGLAAVEAMSSGLPGLVSDVPGLRETVRGAGNSVRSLPSGDVGAWSTAIRELAGIEAHDLQLLGRAARECSQAFTADRMASAYAELYRSLANQ